MLKPGGRVVCLEASRRDDGVGRFLNSAFGVSTRILGRVVARDPDAYAYLPDSVAGFETPDELAIIIQRARFSRVQYRLFGFGLSLAVSALTHAAVAGVPETCAGTASGLNHAVVRAAGLVSVALLGSLAAPGMSNSVSVEGVQRALVLCAVIVAAGGVLVGAFVRDNEPGGLPAAD